MPQMFPITTKAKLIDLVLSIMLLFNWNVIVVIFFLTGKYSVSCHCSKQWSSMYTCMDIMYRQCCMDVCMHGTAHTFLVAIEVAVQYHVLQDKVAVELVGVVVLVTTTAMLIGPLNQQLRLLTSRVTTLEVFLQHRSWSDLK